MPVGSAEPGSLGCCFSAPVCFHPLAGTEQPCIVPRHCCSPQALPTALIDHPTGEPEARVRPCALPTRSRLFWCTQTGLHGRSVRQGGSVSRHSGCSRGPAPWVVYKTIAIKIPSERDGNVQPQNKNKGKWKGLSCEFTVFYTSAMFRISSRAGGWVTGHSPTTSACWPCRLLPGPGASLAQRAINKWINHALQRVCSSSTSA